MRLAQLLKKLATDNGVELDESELEDLGLSDDDPAVDLGDSLPGAASGVVEIFLTAPVGAAVEDGNVVWEPIARAGQWALRPDGKGGKKRVPLRIVAGRSKDQRREIGLLDVKDAFDDEAIEHVTVPESHDNKPTENHGYIKALKIIDGKFKGKPAQFLMGAYDMTEPETKAKMLRGSIPSRSAGFLYDYTRTDNGKTYPVVLEHVALTPKPWLRGMPRFGRKLEASDDLPVATLTLSDDGPSDVEYTEILTDAPEEVDFLASQATVVWPQEESPEWLKGKVNTILGKWREAKRSSMPSPSPYVEEVSPYYRCKDAKPGEALICDGWEEGANHWIAPITVKDGEVELSESTKWRAIDHAWVADTANQSSASVEYADNDVEIDRVALAQATREARSRNEKLDLAVLKAKKRNSLPHSSFAIPEERKFPIHDESHARNALARAAGTMHESRVRAAVKKRYPHMVKDDKKKSNNDQPRGGGITMADDNTLQLLDEARALIQAAEARAASAEQKAEQLSQTVDKLVGTASVTSANEFIKYLKAPVDQGGLGLTEEHGFGGMLNEVHQIMLADDGGPAVQSDHFADDHNKTGELTVSEAMQRVFGALQTAEGSTLKLGEVVTPPSERLDNDKGGGDPGKPPRGDEEVDESKLSDDDLLKLHEKEHPGVLARAGIKLDEGKNGGGS